MLAEIIGGYKIMEKDTGNTEINKDRGNVRFILWALTLIALTTPIVFLTLGLTLIFEAEHITVDKIPAPTIPGELIAISSIAVGALGAFLTSGRNSKD